MSGVPEEFVMDQPDMREGSNEPGDSPDDSTRQLGNTANDSSSNGSDANDGHNTSNGNHCGEPSKATGKEKTCTTTKKRKNKCKNQARADHGEAKRPPGGDRSTRTKYVQLSLMVLTIFAMMLTLVGAKPVGNTEKIPFTVEKFEKQPGIYSEEMGHTKLINDKWHLIVYYKLDQYFGKIGSLK